MRDDYNSHDRRYKNGSGDTFFAFLTGVLIGTVAAFMANPDNRQKVKETFTDVKKKGQKLMTETTKMAKEGAETLEGKAKEFAQKAEEKAKDAEKNLARASRQLRG